MSERYAVQRVLWDLRHDSNVVSMMAKDPEGTLRAYGLSDEEVEAMIRRDFRTLLDFGVNPLLLYFGALEMGISRQDYYAMLNEKDSAEAQGKSSRHG